MGQGATIINAELPYPQYMEVLKRFLNYPKLKSTRGDGTTMGASSERMRGELNESQIFLSKENMLFWAGSLQPYSSAYSR